MNPSRPDDALAAIHRYLDDLQQRERARGDTAERETVRAADGDADGENAPAAQAPAKGLAPADPVSPLLEASRALVEQLERLLTHAAPKRAQAAAPAASGDIEGAEVAGAASTPVIPDDLTRIRAISPARQMQLSALGVLTYAQIAAWRRQDIDRVSAALGLERTITKEGWIEQAALLAARADPPASVVSALVAVPAPVSARQAADEASSSDGPEEAPEAPNAPLQSAEPPVTNQAVDAVPRALPSLPPEPAPAPAPLEPQDARAEDAFRAPAGANEAAGTLDERATPSPNGKAPADAPTAAAEAPPSENAATTAPDEPPSIAPPEPSPSQSPSAPRALCPPALQASVPALLALPPMRTLRGATTVPSPLATERSAVRPTPVAAPVADVIGPPAPSHAEPQASAAAMPAAPHRAIATAAPNDETPAAPAAPAAPVPPRERYSAGVPLAVCLTRHGEARPAWRLPRSLRPSEPQAEARSEPVALPEPESPPKPSLETQVATPAAAPTAQAMHASAEQRASQKSHDPSEPPEPPEPHEAQAKHIFPATRRDTVWTWHNEGDRPWSMPHLALGWIAHQPWALDGALNGAPTGALTGTVTGEVTEAANGAPAGELREALTASPASQAPDDTSATAPASLLQTAEAAVTPPLQGPPRRVGRRRSVPALPAGPDALMLIQGIDVRIEEGLRTSGVTRFAQIATWRALDVALFSKLLRVGGAITRQGWIEQAALLQRGRLTVHALRVLRGEVTALVPSPAPSAPPEMQAPHHQSPKPPPLPPPASAPAPEQPIRPPPMPDVRAQLDGQRDEQLAARSTPGNRTSTSSSHPINAPAAFRIPREHDTPRPMSGDEAIAPDEGAKRGHRFADDDAPAWVITAPAAQPAPDASGADIVAHAPDADEVDMHADEAEVVILPRRDALGDEDLMVPALDPPFSTRARRRRTRFVPRRIDPLMGARLDSTAPGMGDEASVVIVRREVAGDSDGLA